MTPSSRPTFTKAATARSRCSFRCAPDPEIQRRDELKKRLCKEHGIEIIYFSNLRIHYPYFVLEDLGQLLEAIKENGKVDAGRWKHPELPFDFGE